MFYLEDIAAALAVPPFFGYHAVGDGYHFRPRRSGVVDAEVRSAHFVYRVQARGGETRTDARVFQRGLQELSAQAVAVLVPISHPSVLPEGDGTVKFAVVPELCSPHHAGTYPNGVNPPLVEDDREFVVLLKPEEIHAPAEYVLHFAWNACRHAGSNRSVPQRIVRLVYLRRLLAAYQFHLLALLPDRYGVACERYHDVIRGIFLVNEVAQPPSERIVFHEGRVGLSRPHTAHVEYRPAFAVDAVHRGRAYAEAVEDVRQGLSAADLLRDDVVVFIFDAVHEIGGRHLFLFGEKASLRRV